MLGAAGVTQFTQRFGFYLPNTLSGHIKLLTHLFQRVVGIHIDTKAHSQHLGFARSKATQDFSSRFLEAFSGRQINWRSNSGILNEVAQM